MSSTVEPLYQRLAPIYDVIYGAMLQPGRCRAMRRLDPRPGEHILEIGVGTGFALAAYPAGCRVTAVDLSGAMLARAHRRLRRTGIQGVSLCRMDAACLAFPDGRFDAIYAPYFVNVVPDPVAVAREMLRVCRAGGRLVLLNHFDRTNGSQDTVIRRVIGVLASLISGVNWHLDFADFIRQAGLEPVSIEAVNIPRVSSVVVCRKR